MFYDDVDYFPCLRAFVVVVIVVVFMIDNIQCADTLTIFFMVEFPNSFDFAIMLRQQYIERSFREHLARLGVTLRDRTECVDFSTPQQHGGSEDLIHTTLRDLRSGTEYTIKRFRLNPVEFHPPPPLLSSRRIGLKVAGEWVS